MAELDIRSVDGKVVGKHHLSDAIANASATKNTLHLVVVAEQANARQGTQSAKTRSEVRGGGRKPYKQKKTGNARQGTIRAPHYAHGGMALAVKPRDYDKKVNKKERRAALLGALASRFEDGSVTIADRIVFTEHKTKTATDMLKQFDATGVRRVLVILAQYDDVTHRCFRNLPNVTVRTAPSSQADGAEADKTSTFSTRDLLVAHKIVIAQDALKRIEEVWAQ